HRAYRKLVSTWFTPRAIARLTARVEEIARGILDDLAARGRETSCDFVAAVAARLALRVIAEILRGPRPDEDMVLRLSNQGIGSQDPDFQLEGKSARESSRAAIVELFSYFSNLADQRRHAPRDGDLATVLATATLNGEPLAPLELLSYFGLI